MSRARDVASRDIVDGSITNADVASTAAIAASKLDGVVTPTSTSTLTNKTLTSPVVDYALLKAPEEAANVVTSGATGTIAVDVLTSALWFYTGNATGNFTLNFRADGSTTLNSVLPVGASITVSFLNTNGATPYYPTAFQIDGSSVTPKWSGTAPAAGNANAVDAYSFTIVKTAATPTYQVFAGAVKFA